MQENQLKPQPLSGREREGGAFLRKAASLASPPKLEPQLLFGREREGGASLREAASLAVPPERIFYATDVLSGKMDGEGCGPSVEERGAPKDDLCGIDGGRNTTERVHAVSGYDRNHGLPARPRR